MYHPLAGFLGTQSRNANKYFEGIHKNWWKIRRRPGHHRTGLVERALSHLNCQEWWYVFVLNFFFNLLQIGARAIRAV